jgi:hypothetical protein
VRLSKSKKVNEENVWNITKKKKLWNREEKEEI